MSMPCCPTCGETDWKQGCISATQYLIEFDDEAQHWTFGPVEVLEDTETVEYRCMNCDEEADQETWDAIEEVIG